MLSAGFSIGSSNLSEAALRRVLRKLGELHLPSPEGIARGGSPPGGKCPPGLRALGKKTGSFPVRVRFRKVFQKKSVILQKNTCFFL